jgi:hypothetical protein
MTGYWERLAINASMAAWGRAAADALAGGGEVALALGFGRIVASEREAPNMLANLV